MTVRLSALLLFAAVAATSACGNPLLTKATVPTIEDTVAVFALTGAPPNGPTALNVFTPRSVIAQPSTDVNETYDVVFDIRNDTAFALPPHAIGAINETLLLTTTQPYASILDAPSTGWENDSLPVPIFPPAHPGEEGTVVLVKAQAFACRTQQLEERRWLYAKLVVDSVHFTPYDPITNPTGRTIYFRTRVDPNCGFLSFRDGIPTE
jgi:hypothetical protein